MKELKVYVMLLDGTGFFGFVYIDGDNRVQDLLNDVRKFIPILRKGNPINIEDDVYSTIVVNKDRISWIEER